MSGFQPQLLQDHSTGRPMNSRCGILVLGAEVVSESCTPPQINELPKEICNKFRPSMFLMLICSFQAPTIF
jgi:hypothetical protein